MPFHETDVPELLERNRDRLLFTLARATWPRASSSSSASTRRRRIPGTQTCRACGGVVEQLPALEGRPILVMKSTVPVGTGEKVRRGLDARGFEHVGYVSNPEFLSEGHAVEEFLHPDRVVVGAFEPEDGAASRTLCVSRGTARACDVNSAEMIKLAANAALMTRISFINEIANVCEATGADVVKVAKGVGYDKRLGPYFLQGGIGYGGSCFPKDSLALKQLASNPVIISSCSRR